MQSLTPSQKAQTIDRSTRSIGIVMFMDFICEWCYLGKHILDTMHNSYDLRVEYLFCEIHPDTPAGGMPMKLHVVAPKQFYQRINAIGAPYGIHICNRDIFSNTHKALVLAEYAREKGKLSSYMEKVWNRYMLDGDNISDDSVLEDVVSRVGLGPSALEEAVYDPKYSQQLLANQDVAISCGTDGHVPAFVVNGSYLVVGVRTADQWSQIFDAILQGNDSTGFEQ